MSRLAHGRMAWIFVSFSPGMRRFYSRFYTLLALLGKGSEPFRRWHGCYAGVGWSVGNL